MKTSNPKFAAMVMVYLANHPELGYGPKAHATAQAAVALQLRTK